MQSKTPLFSLLGILLSSSFSYADVSTTLHHLYQSNRAMGMGDAFVAVADDYSALFYNPAGLARREDSQVNLSIDAGASPNFSSTYTKFNNIEKSGEDDTSKETDLLNLVTENYGKTYSARTAPVAGIWVTPNWGIGFIPADVSVEMDFHKGLGPYVNTTAYLDSTMALGYGDDFRGVRYGRLSWGITGKFVNRAYMSKALYAVDLATKSQFIQGSDFDEGYTADADLGLLWTPDIPAEGFWSVFQSARPTFGAVVRNVGQLGFAHSFKIINKNPTDDSHPESLYRVVDLGTRFEFPRAWIFGGRFVADARDLGMPYFVWRRSLHAGLEMDWTMWSWWKGQYRVGVSQGYWTAGVSAELGIFNLDLVSYADDVGTVDMPVESRVYAVKLNLDF